MALETECRKKKHRHQLKFSKRTCMISTAGVQSINKIRICPNQYYRISHLN